MCRHEILVRVHVLRIMVTHLLRQQYHVHLLLVFLGRDLFADLLAEQAAQAQVQAPPFLLGFLFDVFLRFSVYLNVNIASCLR